MPNIRAIDMRLIDDIFRMGDGYVLDFNNTTFAEFFVDELGVNINDEAWFAEGSSKAKRLRFFLRKSDPDKIVTTLKALWEYRLIFDRKEKRNAPSNEQIAQFTKLIERIASEVMPKPSAVVGSAPFDFRNVAHLKQQLLDLSKFAPQPRGYAFEKWLTDLFNGFELQARNPFKNRGEQIDGSFVLGSETYLIEAKWQDASIGVKDLHAFHGKIAQKAAWTRGLFVSNSGFSDDGLQAFGRGKSVICMDGLDLFDMLNAEIPLPTVLEQKVRRASETGNPFVRVRELFHI